MLIVGTGLTSYDAVLTIYRSGFKGRAVMVSRHGFTHKPYPGDHLHDILPLPLPSVPDIQLTVDGMMHQLEEEIKRGKEFIRVTQPLVSDDVIEERVLKALEPWLAKWIQRCAKSS